MVALNFHPALRPKDPLEELMQAHVGGTQSNGMIEIVA
jgi:hypothetical protein